MNMLNRLTHPHRPESYDPSADSGALIGWIPGEIEDNNDVHKIGRVKVRIDLVDPMGQTPVGEDGYAYLLEEFVNNNVSGGSHRLMPIGTQVALLPMIGDPTKLLVLGAIPSFVDSPSPEVDRSKGLHGSETPGGVIKLGDDVNSAEVEAFPNGVVQSVSSDGSIHRQTDGGARDTLSVDGTVVQQNNEGSTTIAPDGAIVSTNSSQASTALTPDGEVVATSSTGAEMRVGQSLLELVGPPDKINSLLDQLGQELSGLQEALQSALGDLKGFVGNVLSQEVLDLIPDVLSDAPKLLGEATSLITEHLGKAQEVLSAIGGLDLSPEDLGGNIAGQVSNLLQVENLDGIFEDVDAAIAQVLSGDWSPEQVLEQFDLPTDARAIVASLKTNPDALYKYLIKQVLGEVGNIDNLLESGMERVIPELTSFLDSNPGDLQGLIDRIPIAQALHSRLPKNIQSLITSDILNRMGSVEQLMGQVSQIRLGSLGDALPGAIADIEGLVSGFADQIAGFSPDLDGLSQVGELLGGLEGKMKDVLQGIESQAKELTDLVNNEGRRGPVFQLLEDAIEAAVDLPSGGAIASPKLSLGKAIAEISGGIPGSPKMIVSQAEAALESVGSKVFAGGGTAGLSTPWGGFSLGSLGGSLLAKGKMVFQALQENGNATGIFFSELGQLALGEFDADGLFRNSSGDAFISIEKGLINLNPAGSAKGIALTPEGVFLEDTSVQYILERLTYFDDRYNSLSSSLSSLQAQVDAAAAATPPEPTP